MEYEFLDTAFLEAMNEIGRVGSTKVGADDFMERRKRGDYTRGKLNRHESKQIICHAMGHNILYLQGVPHDATGKVRDHLAAAAYNAMMEFCFTRKFDVK